MRARTDDVQAFGVATIQSTSGFATMTGTTDAPNIYATMVGGRAGGGGGPRTGRERGAADVGAWGSQGRGG
jgi:hypothetical protein